jgi:hypothetical protein
VTLPAAQPVDVMAYYFPQWHAHPTNAAIIAPGWTEWDVLRRARPRFPGHLQPKRPAWGVADESDPAHATKVVATAIEHGISGFLVDWYWYDNHPFLNGALDRGLLQADRIDEFKFALMWANHDWTYLYPAPHPNPAVLLPAPSSAYHVRQAFAHILERYLLHPSYWRIGGAPYFSIYDLPALIRGLGGVGEAAAALDEMRRAAVARGLPGLHLNGVLTTQIQDPSALIAALGLDSATHYTWWHHDQSGFDTFPTSSYVTVAARARSAWELHDATLPAPYLPNVTMGWDPTPRTVEWAMEAEEGYPFTSVLVDNTPERVGAAVHDALVLVSGRSQHRAITINAWNEWTEGSYLEPDEDHGLSYLQEIKTAIGMATRSAAAGERTR